MPWRVVKRDCKQSDEKSGSWVVLKVKGDDSTEQSSCHTSKEKAQGSVAARKMSEGRKMNITKRQLRRIINEALSSGSNVNFDWTPDGLSMVMYVDGKEAMSFMTQKEVRSLITQLEDLLAGPMRMSP